MRKLKFLFGSHCHQPVGNFDSVYEEAMRTAYEPFFAELARFPEIRMSVHLSGPLIEWIEEHRPAFLDLVGSLAAEGRLELLGGGFYEPVLAAIAERDRIGQLEMMNRYLKKRFGAEARGAWMAERVWEPQVIGALLRCGIRYAVIDDYHFKAGGLNGDDLDGYYVTEDGGRPLALFPISEALRYAIPFAEPEETIDYLRGAYEDGKNAVAMMDDGEKFGLWPGTRERCYKEGWLRSFFTLLQENSDWLETATPAQVLESLPPSGIVYLPTASYFEMSEWTLPAERAGEFSKIVRELRDSGQLERYRPFLRGGIWRNFFSKYPESNNMHKRVLALSDRIDSLRRRKTKQNRDLLETAERELYCAQCNCAYWHGVFGGLYLPHLRDAVYRHAIRAEKAADKLEFPDGRLPAVQRKDLNLDSVPELVLRSPELTAICAPRYGGALYELDFRPLDFNLLNTLASRPEGYHESFVSPPWTPEDTGETPSIHDIAHPADDGLRAALKYDWHNRYSLLDHCLHPDTDLARMQERSFRELGDFVNMPYEAEEEKGRATMRRRGHLYTGGGIIALEIEKRLKLRGGELEISYCLTNRGEREAGFVFAPEFNFSMLSGDDERLRYAFPASGVRQPKLNSDGEVDKCGEIRIEDTSKGLAISLRPDPPATIWYFPSQTVSQSESGFELIYQSSVILTAWRLRMRPGDVFRFSIILSVSPMHDQD